jgi:hypothetical protein
VSIEPETTPVSPAPVTIDYTGRDYYSLRDALITRVKDRVNTNSTSKWYGNDPADFGVALIEAFSYMGDVVSYYIDRIANESSIFTATQRESIYNLAIGLGYTPSGYKSATCSVRFTRTTSGSTATIPAGTQVTGTVTVNDTTVRLTFTTTEAAAFGSSDTVITVPGTHGEYVSTRPANAASGAGDIAGELIGRSDGTAFQSYAFRESQVVDGTTTVYVKTGDVYGVWNKVEQLIDYSPVDSVYRLNTNANNTVYITFGDGVSGAIPVNHADIKADYLYGGGTIGNIPIGALSYISYVPGDPNVSAYNATYTVTNTTVGTGGVDPESIDSIKANAPLATTALNRAVSLSDYISLAQQNTLVGKANAISTVWSNVTVYVAPRRDANSTDYYPGKNETNTALTTEWTDLQTSVVTSFEDKTQIGVQLTISPPTYSNVSVGITYSKFPQFTAAVVEAYIQEYIEEYYSFLTNSFGQVIHPEEIEFLLRYAPGINNVKVTTLYRTGEAAIRNSLSATAGEIFVFKPSNLVITALSTVATLHTFSATNSSAFSPTWTSGNTFGDYTTTVTPGSADIAVTAVPTDADAKTYINGTAAYSGGTSTPKTVTTPVGVTEITILVVAEDGTTSKTYTLTAVRIS